MTPGQIWRGFGTALFLTLVGVGGTLMAVTLFPLITLLTRNPDIRRTRIQTLLHHTFRLYCAAIQALRLADISFSGTEKLQKLRGTLLIANHPSMLDVVMIMATLPHVQCVVKANLWRNPFFRLTVSGAGYIRNDLPPDDFVAACAHALQQGQNLIIFPEGTRTLPGTLPRLRRGFANIATIAEANVQLLTLRCDPPILYKGHPWWIVPKDRSSFHLSVGECLDIKQFMVYPFRALAARKLAEHVNDYYVEHLTYDYAGE